MLLSLLTCHYQGRVRQRSKVSGKILRLAGGKNTVTTYSSDDYLEGGEAFIFTNEVKFIEIIGSRNTGIETGIGNDEVVISNGTNYIDTGRDDDNISLRNGSNTVFSNIGHDFLNIQDGDNTIFTASGSDDLTISGGNNAVVTGEGGDSLNISGGSNSINSGNGGDNFNITGGINTIKTGPDNDRVTLSDGSSNVDLGSGDDILSVTSSVDLSTHVFNGGDGDDSLSIIHTGTVSLPGPQSISSIETIFVSNSQHQSIDFSRFASIPSITLDSGTTIDGSTITT